MKTTLKHQPIKTPLSIGISLNAKSVEGCPYFIIAHMAHTVTTIFADDLYIAVTKISEILDDYEWGGSRASDEKWHMIKTYPHNIIHVHIEIDPNTGTYYVHDMLYDVRLLSDQDEKAIRDLTLGKLIDLVIAAQS